MAWLDPTEIAAMAGRTFLRPSRAVRNLPDVLAVITLKGSGCWHRFSFLNETFFLILPALGLIINAQMFIIIARKKYKREDFKSREWTGNC
jgi:hypothetical protein